MKLVARRFSTHWNVETVRLSSAIIEGAPKNMVILHGLFGNKGTFRYLAQNEQVSISNRVIEMIDQGCKD